MAAVTIQAEAKAKPSSHIDRSIGICGFTGLLPSAGGGAASVFGIRKRLMGKPIRTFAAAQTRQVSRQPMVSSPHWVSGQPTVLAKPAIRVMPVIARRALSP